MHRVITRISLRDVASMQCRQPSLEGTGEVPLRRLVKEALRMRPSRIMGLVIAGIGTSANNAKACSARPGVVVREPAQDCARVRTSAVLFASVVAGLNILVAGGTQAGKPTSAQYTPPRYVPIEAAVGIEATES